jgi:hypothetical protein
MENSTRQHNESAAVRDMMGLEREVLRPLTEEPSVFTFVLCTVLLVSLIVGISGNGSLFGLIVYVRNWVDRSPRNRNVAPVADSTKCCVLLLCLINFGICLSIPPMIIEYLTGLWLLGAGICKLYRTVAAGGNIFINFLILAITCDRFAAFSVSPESASNSRRCSLLLRLSGFSLITILLVTPTLLYSGLEELILEEKSDEHGVFALVQSEKCSEVLPTGLFYLSVYSNVLVGFAIPFTFTVFLDVTVLRRLFSAKKLSNWSSQRIRAEQRAALSTMFVGLLHFVTCLPNWTIALYSNVVLSNRHTQPIPSHFELFFSVLPFIGSALSWIPIGMLNDRLEKLEQCDVVREPSLHCNYDFTEMQPLENARSVQVVYRQRPHPSAARKSLPRGSFVE